MKSIYSMTIQDLENYLLNINEKKYRASQIIDWLYIKRVNSFESMTNLTKELINKLEKDFYFDSITIMKKQHAEDVSKYLLKLEDNNTIEAVLMNHNYGNSLCISTQVGCNMSCRFCESGRLKKIRDLTTGELVSELLIIENEIGIRISHIVIMGIGEPFDNYDNFTKFIEIVNYNKGINLGSRHITVSTCGIVNRIREFMNFPYQVNLAISLHASNDEIRSSLMPINKVYNIEKLIKVIKEYIEKTSRRVTFEYIMLDGINDRIEDAKELSQLLKGINCYVNLIPYNETDALYKRSKKENVFAFYDILKKNNIQVTIRREFGSGIDAACGQLRAKGDEIK